MIREAGGVPIPLLDIVLDYWFGMTIFIGILRYHGRGAPSREESLAATMGMPPGDPEFLDPSRSARDFAHKVDSHRVCLVFDQAFWYPKANWEAWLDALSSDDDSKGYVDVPLGNQDPAWSMKFPPVPYCTSRGLERASSSMRPSVTWFVTRPSRIEAFCVVVVEKFMLEKVPGDITLAGLPGFWLDSGVKCRVFCRGWLHSFSSLREAGNRDDLLRMCTWEGRVLELGCDRGLMASRCETRYVSNVEWIGVDFNADALGEAVSHMDLAVQADVQDGLPFVEAPVFDRIVCADFLEHLPYPWDTLKQLRRYIRPGGLLVASFPNIGHWSIIEDLLCGRFDEAPSGILCVTHLRFGTKKNWERWLLDAGWMPELWEYERLGLPPGWCLPRQALEGEGFDLESLETLRFCVVARPV